MTREATLGVALAGGNGGWTLLIQVVVLRLLVQDEIIVVTFLDHLVRRWRACLSAHSKRREPAH